MASIGIIPPSLVNTTITSLNQSLSTGTLWESKIMALLKNQWVIIEMRV